MVDVSCDFVDDVPSPHVITLLSLRQILFITWPWYWSVTWLCGWGPLILSHNSATFGAGRIFGSGNNGVCSISFNSRSNSNAEVPMPRFTNGHLGIGTWALELELELELISQTPIFSIPLGLWTPNFGGWWLRMRGPLLQSHVTRQYHGHVTNEKCYISNFTMPMDAKRSRLVT